MDKLALKLMTLESTQQSSQVPSAIFGTAGSLSQSLNTRPAFRFGMWPCISSTQPEVAMGFFTALANYLERWQAVRVYRLFINHEDASPEDFVWDISKSQFEVEEWHVEGLDENVGLWGTLEFEGDQWLLSLDIEYDDDSGDAEELSLTFRKSSLVALVNALPEITDEIIEALSIPGVTTEMPASFDGSDNELETLLKAIFKWEIATEIALWGRVMSEDEIVQQHEALIRAGTQRRNEFSAWAVSALTAHAMKPGFGNVATVIGYRALLVVDEFSNFPAPIRVIAAALYRAGRVQEGLGLLEQGTETHPSDPNIWITLAESKRLAGKLNDALDVFQSAVEEDAVSFILYARYASLLKAMTYDDWNVDEFILCDIDKVKSNQILWEIAEAYEEALRLEPENAEIMELQITQLTELGAFDRAIRRFKQLMALDDEGDRIRQVIDSLYDYDLDDEVFLEDIVSALKQHLTETDDVKWKINLAAAYIVNGDDERARQLLETVQDETEDTALLIDISHLLLTIDDPDFEMRLTEMRQILDAGNELELKDVDYLEDILERAPTLSEIYILLSKAYLAMDEDDNALETLLDGQKEIPNDPDIIVNLAEVLWDTEEDELALDYLEKALDEHPNSIPLLASLGQYTFEVGDHDEARAYLARAEALAPTHPALVAARVKVTQLLQEEDDEDE